MPQQPPPKVLSLVSYTVFPPVMGGQKGVALFNRYFSKHVQLHCVTTRANTGFETEPYPVHTLLPASKTRYINPFLFFKLRRFIKQNGITHLLLEHPYYGWLGMLLKWFAGVKLIVHSHNIEALRFKTMGKWWWGILWNYEKLTHRQAHYNFFINDDDRLYAEQKFKLKPARCTTITYGIEWNEPPTTMETARCREWVCRQHSIDPANKLLLFNGTLDYRPNLLALEHILEHINPLLQKSGLRYKLLVCGKGLPPAMNGLAGFAEQDIVYAGFVNDIGVYFKAADVFLNPLTEGGGIKTKLVEAVGYGKYAVSTQNGAIGVLPNVAGPNLAITADNDWPAFAAAVAAFAGQPPVPANTPFFNWFFWDNIAAKAARFIQTA